LNIDDFPNVYFLNGDNQLVIQGEGYFDTNASYPLGVKTDAEGKVKFMIDGLENFDINQNIFIYDSTDNSYHNIKNENYEVVIAGENNDRFSLRFTDKTLSTVDEKKKEESIIITHFKKNIIEIHNNSFDTSIKKNKLVQI
jgi:3-deoxy-D-arabino-heptulosonate 7-phosphate (DAHP) synthase